MVGAAGLIAWVVSASAYVAAVAALTGSAVAIAIDLSVVVAELRSRRRSSPVWYGEMATLAVTVPLAIALGLLVVIWS